jgi:heparin/heparan-sulfate lyase
MPIPPKEHPRLYLRSKQVAELPVRMKDPELAKVWEELNIMKADRKPNEIPATKDWRYYFDSKGLLTRAELKAMDYLISKDKKTGREAIGMIIDTLEKAKYPEIQDISRGIGRLMVTGAVVYDWCYDQLKPAEKTRFVNAFVRLAKMLECGYPPVKDYSTIGHACEWMIMRDLLSASIAIYDEFPEMYNLTAGRFFKEILPFRNWFYPSHGYHQGMSYLNVRFSNDLFALWILDRMGAGYVYNPSQQFVLYDMMYKRRPDGQILAGGDLNFSRKDYKSFALPSLLAGSYYKDEYLNNEFLNNSKIENQCKLFDFLWRDTDLARRKPDDLPLTRYSGSPYGWMIARTGWGAESVIAEMKINEYHFLNHQHHDGGAFQIYYKGPLAIDAGAYEGNAPGGYNSAHVKNYAKRTISHNSLLVYDPKEIFPSANYGGANKTDFVGNDGGQRLPGNKWGPAKDLNEYLNSNFKTGTILANGFGPGTQSPDYSYLKGDITEAYSAKVKEVKRSFVFLNLKDANIPAALIVFDKVVASNPDFKKFWLLHSIEQPEIAGNQITIKRTKNDDSGMLVNTVLLPDLANADIQPVGGKGKEFWVFGTNYTFEMKPGQDEANERGEWRVEISPKKAASEDYYLNVMQITNNTQKSMYAVKRIDGDKVVGVQIADRITSFSKNFMIIDRSFGLSVKGNEVYKMVLTDLLPGTWQVMKDGKVFLPAVVVRNDDAILYMEGTAGEYRFLR